MKSELRPRRPLDWGNKQGQREMHCYLHALVSDNVDSEESNGLRHTRREAWAKLFASSRPLPSFIDLGLWVFPSSVVQDQKRQSQQNNDHISQSVSRAGRLL
ncbi:hypothetical protein PoB_007276800 [Plakobranchus ocellatus]|uniref:Uncharacterized protein n=1 Tax=Plakobranchus ocellatus TaxID=259542 RepID=A0AAV4DPK7_9GAST|nr:hypothetical protein PoB_007276800 [Plakobranchus ocellatus]